MNCTAYDIAQLVVQVVAVVALLLTFYVYYRQLRTMQEQLQAARHASSAQNILTLIHFLQAPEVRDARETVLARLSRKAFKEWTDMERRQASLVCSTYDAAAIIIRMGVVPPGPFVDNWGVSIRLCYQVTEPLIEEMQRPENCGPTYWDDFAWLYTQVPKATNTGTTPESRSGNA